MTYYIAKHINCYVSTIDVRDSSGIEFFYLSEPRSEEAGIITLGHHVNNAMIIPPRTTRHDIFGKCGSVCTSEV